MEGRRIENNKAFQELLNVFMPEKHNFIEFDSVKYEQKRKVNMKIINEQWKEIDGFNYSVSNYGRVKKQYNK